MAETPCEMRATLDALYCGAALINREGVLEHANPRLCEMLGRRDDEVVGRALSDFCATEHDRGYLRRVEADFDAPAEFELNLRAKGYVDMPVMVSGRPLQGAPGDKTDLRVLTLIDITPQRSLLRHTAELGETLIEQGRIIRRQNAELEDRVRERTTELYQANLDAVLMLAVASEVRDNDTGAHVRRIERLARQLAAALGMPTGEAEHLGLSAVLHDVGKIHIPDHIIKKPGPLTDDERRHIQSHTLAGEAILGNNPFFTLARTIARSHHENWDGTGYPDRLVGGDTPLAARIVRLVDVYDALRSARVYKRPWPADKARAEVVNNAGTLFDPDLVQHFDTLWQGGEVEAVMRQLGVLDEVA